MRKAFAVAAMIVAASTIQPGSAVVDSDLYHHMFAEFSDGESCLQVWSYQDAYTDVDVIGASVDPEMYVYAIIYGSAEGDCSGDYTHWYGSSAEGQPVLVLIDPTGSAGVIAARLEGEDGVLELAGTFAANPLAPPAFNPYLDPGSGYAYDDYYREGTAVVVAEGGGFSSSTLESGTAWSFTAQWLAAD